MTHLVQTKGMVLPVLQRRRNNAGIEAMSGGSHAECIR